MSKTDSTYVPLSRGLCEHLPDMNDKAFKIYAYILMNANPLGTQKGCFSIPIGLLASDLKMHRITMQKTINKHLKDKYLEIIPGKNQHSTTIFKVLKYKNVSDFACSDKTTTTTTSNEQPPLQAGNKQVTSDPSEPAIDGVSQAPKKLRSKEDKELKKNLIYIFDFWNTQNIIIHRSSLEIDKAIKHTLKVYSEEEITEAILNYNMLLKSDKSWLDYKWTLITFLTQKQKNSIETFLRVNKPWERYQLGSKTITTTATPVDGRTGFVQVGETIPIIKSNNPRAEKLWNEAKKTLKDKVDQEPYETWFAPTVGLEASARNGLTIGVPLQLHFNWLTEHYSELIRDVLGGREFNFKVVENGRSSKNT